MTDTLKKKKAKRVLKDFNFEEEGCALALVGPDVGGPANGVPTLMIKSTKQFSDEFLKKAQKIRIEMELPDFLEKFFDVYGSDAQVLAQLMGYVPDTDVEEVYSTYQDYIEERLEAFEIIKAVNESESIAGGLSALSEDNYLGMLRDQERLEKHLAKVDSAKEEIEKSASLAKQPTVAEDKPNARIVKDAVQKDEGHKKADVVVSEDSGTIDAKTAAIAETNLEVTKMTKEAVKVEQTTTVEMVEKAQLESIQKANEELNVKLTKALESLSNFEEKEKERVTKQRKEALKDVLGEDESVEVVFKALNESAEDEFNSVVEVFKAVSAKSDENVMFQEKGVSVEGDGVVVDEKSKIRANIQKKYQTK